MCSSSRPAADSAASASAHTQTASVSVGIDDYGIGLAIVDTWSCLWRAIEVIDCRSMLLASVGAGWGCIVVW